MWGVAERARHNRDGGTGAAEVFLRRPLAPIKWWAAAARVILAFEIYILVKWITRPYFHRVPAGVSKPPERMKAVMNTAQVVSIPMALVFLTGSSSGRGARTAALPPMACCVWPSCSCRGKTPVSSYFGHWFTYNSYLFNRGPWVYELPGWLSFGEPGAEVASPVLVWMPLYIYVFLGLLMLGATVMRKAKARWPRL